MKTTLLIMAAGIGSRFGTGIKQLEPVDDAGHIIMDYSIHDAIGAGFNHVVFIIRKGIEKEFKEVIGDRIASICSAHNVTVDYAFQDISDMGKLSCKISQFCNVGNDVVMNVKFFGYGLFPYINGNGIASLFSRTRNQCVLHIGKTNHYILSPFDAFILFGASHSVILLHFIVAKQLPISRRRSAANTFMWSQIAKIQDFVRTVGMGNGIPIKIAGNEKSRK